MSPPLGVTAVKLSMYAISGEVLDTPVSLYRTTASTVAPVTAVKVTSAASAVPRVLVLLARLPEVATIPERSLWN